MRKNVIQTICKAMRKGGTAVAVALLLTVVAGAAELSVSPASLEQWNQQGRRFVLVDVRAEAAYNHAHLPGAINVPLELLPHKALPKDVDLVVYGSDLSGRAARQATEALATEGYTRIYTLQGGLKAWEAGERVSVREAGGFTAQAERVISSADLKEAQRIGLPLIVVDLRDQKSFANESIPQAVNVPLLRSPEELKQVKTDVLSHAVRVPSSRKARLRTAADEGNNQLVAEILAQEIAAVATGHQKALGTGKSGVSIPVILVDDNGGLALRLVDELPAQGLREAYVLENGMTGWATAKGVHEPKSETIEHFSVSTSPRKP